ncbi:MAG: uroporphyrinogen decarboxylase [bacterium]|nr:uroporphyrinogen decarboxylase [bacterium]
MGKLSETLLGKTFSSPPVWLMRQAGRFLPEYRKLRETCPSFMEFCFTPQKAIEATLQPLQRFDLDAAIIFSDILTVPYAMGQKIWFEGGVGPRLAPLPPVKNLKFDLQALGPVYEAISQTRAQLDPSKDLIGFAGAPWTLACYMIEGGGSKSFDATRQFAYEYSQTFSSLFSILESAVAEHLMSQVDAGANVLQIFDSWAGVVPGECFKAWVIDPTKRIVQAVKAKYPKVPIVGFPRGSGAFLSSYAQHTGVDCVGVDTMTPLSFAASQIPETVALQGNIDPALLVVGGGLLKKFVTDSLSQMAGRPYVINLGHGVVPHTPPEHVTLLLECVRRASEHRAA